MVPQCKATDELMLSKAWPPSSPWSCIAWCLLDSLPTTTLSVFPGSHALFVPQRLSVTLSSLGIRPLGFPCICKTSSSPAHIKQAHHNSTLFFAPDAGISVTLLHTQLLIPFRVLRSLPQGPWFFFRVPRTEWTRKHSSCSTSPLTSDPCDTWSVQCNDTKLCDKA